MKIATCNPQPGCVFDFEIVLSTRCETQLYIVYYFFYLYIIYMVRIHAHARQRRIGKSCGLQVAFSTPSEKRNFAILQLNLATFGIRYFGAFKGKRLHVSNKTSSHFRKAPQGSPKCFTIASTSGRRKVRRLGL